MKTFLASFITLVAIASSMAGEPVQSFTESYDLFASPTEVVNPNCHFKTVMVQDFAKHTIQLHEKVGGTCKIYVQPNFRTYQVGPGVSSGQGVTIRGERVLEDGTTALLIVRDVRSAVAATYNFEISVTEVQPNDAEITRYTLIQRQ